jgi:hypothetical protein
VPFLEMSPVLFLWGCLPAVSLPPVRRTAYTPAKLEGKNTAFSFLAFYTNPTPCNRNTYQLGSYGCSYFPSLEAPEGNLGFTAGVRILLQRNY